MEHRQDIAYQRDLFIGQNMNTVRPSENCEDINGAKAGQVGQLNKERQQRRALAEELLVIPSPVFNRINAILNTPYTRIKFGLNSD